MEFKNRTAELERLNKMSASGKKEMLVLYGRRRLGKTTLLRQFARKKRALFFSCPQSTSSEALRLFQNQMADAFEEELLRKTRFPGWPEAMHFAFEKAGETGTAIIFDEFPYLMRSVKGIDSILQHEWDAMVRPIQLSLCGSLITMMLEKVAGPGHPFMGVGLK